MAHKTPKKSAAELVGAKPVLLSGDNPQIAKADGDAPVQAYIAAMPGWKGDVGRRLDALIVRTVPGVRKAVRWNTPFYGIEGQGWFLGLHCMTKYIKVAFFRGTSLRPVPPVESKQKEVRYFHIEENDPLDEELAARWIKQASELPGWSFAPATEGRATTSMKKATTMKKTKGDSKAAKDTLSPPSDWRAETLARIRLLIQQADPDAVEEPKWKKPSNAMRGVPVWSHGGILCTGETYKNAVKLTFAKGASLADPSGLFNSSLEGNTRRAIDIHEGDKIDEKAFQALIRAAVALNTSAQASARPVRSQKKPKNA
jgi:hypothetical protein